MFGQEPAAIAAIVTGNRGEPNSILSELMIMSYDHKPDFGQTVKEGIGLGIGMRIGAGVADIVGDLVKAVGPLNILGAALLAVLILVGLVGLGFVVLAAVSPLILLLALLTGHGQALFAQDVIVIPALVGVIAYFVVGCAALLGCCVSLLKKLFGKKAAPAAKLPTKATRDSRPGLARDSAGRFRKMTP